jgi:hypothetical protein
MTPLALFCPMATKLMERAIQCFVAIERVLYSHLEIRLLDSKDDSLLAGHL